MNCRETLTMLSGYMDGELDLVHRVEIERHLQHCPECANNLHEGCAVQRSLQSQLLYHAAPMGLERRVLAAVRAAEGTQSHPSRRFVRPAVGIAAFTGVLALIWFAAARIPTAIHEEATTQQVVYSHVRSLMVTHLLDVGSADPNIVKPWFNAKLDYTPPVEDLRTAGYPLLGGRLDYLDDRAVAVVVYTSQKHIVNLFLWPTAGPATKMTTRECRHGVRLCQWATDNMTFWAVSDLNAHDLTQFAQAVHAHVSPLDQCL